MKTQLEVERVTKSYDTPVLRGLDFTVAEGALCSVIGPNGCGKTTLLRLLAGLEQQDSGDIRLEGEPLQTAVDAGRRVGVVFQEPRLLPWRRLRDNVVLPLRSLGTPQKEAEERADRYLDLVGLGGFEDYFPGRLSGGMQQRGSIARALACEPELLLMDEPFSALDAQNRRFMHEELLRIWEETRPTIVFVTHAIDEAIRLGTQVVVLSGRPTSVTWSVQTEGEDPAELQERMLDLLAQAVVAQDRAAHRTTRQGHSTAPSR